MLRKAAHDQGLHSLRLARRRSPKRYGSRIRARLTSRPGLDGRYTGVLVGVLFGVRAESGFHRLLPGLFEHLLRLLTTLMATALERRLPEAAEAALSGRPPRRRRPSASPLVRSATKRNTPSKLDAPDNNRVSIRPLSSSQTVRLAGDNESSITDARAGMPHRGRLGPREAKDGTASMPNPVNASSRDQSARATSTATHVDRSKSRVVALPKPMPARRRSPR
jgi:hypothetical protein